MRVDNITKQIDSSIRNVIRQIDTVVRENRESIDRCIKAQVCEFCKWHDDFSWVCFNGESEKRADFTNNDDCCIEWESREDKSCEKKI